MHYLALTFSTLLSSQASGAHRAEELLPGLGQLDLLYEVYQTHVKPAGTPPHRTQKTPALRLLTGERATHR